MSRTDEQVMTIREAADAIGVSRQTIYRWIRTGKVPRPTLRRCRDGSQVFSAADVGRILEFATGVENAIGSAAATATPEAAR